eukprot:1182787-Prorocentrum_minimum.AAC.5
MSVTNGRGWGRGSLRLRAQRPRRPRKAGPPSCPAWGLETSPTRVPFSIRLFLSFFGFSHIPVSDW